jgi:cadmium resistance protein CadD (predicted permease)
MLIHAEVFMLAFLGCVGTNIDNLLLVMATGSPNRARASAMVFLFTLGAVIGLAFLASLAVDVALPRAIMWLGLIPLMMGVYELNPQRKGKPESTGGTAMSITGMALPLAINSFDTLLVQAVLFSDFATQYHLTALLGSTGAAALLAWMGFRFLTRPVSVEKLLPLASKARPWILIAVGVLIMTDTAFDAQ